MTVRDIWIRMLARAGLGLLLWLPVQAEAQSRAYADWLPLGSAPRRDYDIRLGSWFFDASASLRVEYDDNITSTEFNRQSDVIITPGVSIGGSWAWSDLNTLRVGVGLRYRYFLQNRDLSTGGEGSFLDITPETELETLIFVGDAVIRLFDRLLYQTDATDVIARDPETGELIFDAITYGLFVNTLGAQISYDFNLFEATGQIYRRDTFSLQEAFEYSNAVEYQISGTLNRRLTPTLLAGAGASMKTVRHEQAVKDDLDGASVGVFANWQLTPFITTYAGINFGHTTLIAAAGEQNREVERVSYNISVSHTLNAQFDHVLGYTVETVPGGLADLLERRTWSYTWSWVDFTPFDLSGAFSWAHREEFGNLLPEEARTFNASITARRPIGSRSEFALGYRYTNKDSNRLFRSYTRNVFWAEFRYDI